MRKVISLLLVSLGLLLPRAQAAAEALHAPEALSLSITREGFAQAVQERYGVDVQAQQEGAFTVLSTPAGAVSDGFSHPVTIRGVFKLPDTLAYIQYVFERMDNGYYYGAEPDERALITLLDQALDLYIAGQEELNGRYGAASHGVFSASSVGAGDERYYDYPQGADAQDIMRRAMEVEDTVYLASYRGNVSAYLHMWRFRKEDTDKLMLDLRVTYAREAHAIGSFAGQSGPYAR